ncbi:hypothetical protein J8L98_19745 [Pseudoalteromonas sp. MMG013]|uniref:Orphan protein n=1 Tax=Pseudoalteromonas aurantia 208 TaxID=1314867 RepID=A0ABR9E6Y5_9GAMM|nr:MULTISPECIES: hypothetical protein [Pseudoalteromonas]MBE0366749.1 hypothetical protein [Pseudoalteromonas aurantia 208]MBQ4848090.1 hypothetical protein [Pseudoalteromonas sp. MMG005]MBQ4850598.1 hypothetical protein [Pseudoalteromonas sp. MMG012]MBQ4863924.1 hypothetical protein [Pseudoalteromonas sp. MMG013]
MKLSLNKKTIKRLLDKTTEIDHKLTPQAAGGRPEETFFCQNTQVIYWCTRPTSPNVGCSNVERCL